MENKDILFKKIFHENSSKIYHLCLGYAGDEDIANDLVQETFIKVWQNLEGFRNQSQLSTWVYRIAVNTCLSYLRVEKRKNNDSISSELIENLADEQSPKQDQINQLYKSISRLEENERIIITMVLDEVPYPEIAEIFAISEGNLRVRIHRIKQKITRIYNQYERF